MKHLTPQTLTLWILRGLLAAAFLFFGAQKFFVEWYAEQVVAWGFPAGFHFVIGAVELLGAALLLAPALTFFGVALLTLTMIGAALTHLRAGDGALVLVPLTILVLLTVTAWLRWEERK